MYASSFLRHLDGQKVHYFSRVCDELRKGGKQEISGVFEDLNIPEVVLHQFSVECAERTLSRFETEGVVLDESFTDAVQKKREWVMGGVDLDGLLGWLAEVGLLNVIPSFVEWKLAGEQVSHAVLNCVESALYMNSGFRAATNVSFWAIYVLEFWKKKDSRAFVSEEDELAWQCNRFSFLLDDYVRACRSFWRG